MNELETALAASVSSLRAQTTRLRIVSENLANANSTAQTPGGNPYTRKTVSFGQELDRASGAMIVKAREAVDSHASYRLEYQPGHPAADASGMVKLPNVEPLVEMADMREANRSYEANLQVIKQVRDMIGDLVDLIKGK